MTRAEDVQRYADVIMAMIKEDQGTGQVPRGVCSWDDSMTASMPAIITGWLRCRRASARRPACGTPCTMRLAGAWPEHKVTHSGQPGGAYRRSAAHGGWVARCRAARR